MKNFLKIVIVMVPILAVVAYSAAPTLDTFVDMKGDVTVDSFYNTGNSNWECLDSLYYICTDTANIVMSITGVAALDPGDILYIGFGRDSANRVDSHSVKSGTGLTHSNLDTFVVKAPKWMRGKTYVPFAFEYTYSYTSQTDLTDTVYFNASVGGETSIEKVELYDVFTKISIFDRSAGNPWND